MKNLSRIALVALSLIVMLPALSARELHVVPQPAYTDIAAEGDYTVTPKTRIVVVDNLWNPAERFTEDMQRHFGTEKPMPTAKNARASRFASTAAYPPRATR